MKRYIKINNSNEITDLFFECWTDRFDGTEIYLDDKEFPDCTINGKYISNEYGAFVFKYVSGAVIGKSSLEILTDQRTKNGMIKKLIDELIIMDTDTRRYDELIDLLDANNILKKDKFAPEALAKIEARKLKRAELDALLNS